MPTPPPALRETLPATPPLLSHTGHQVRPKLGFCRLTPCYALSDLIAQPLLEFVDVGICLRRRLAFKSFAEAVVLNALPHVNTPPRTRFRRFRGVRRRLNIVFDASLWDQLRHPGLMENNYGGYLHPTHVVRVIPSTKHTIVARPGGLAR